jgi:cytochrome c-type biogenesis protein CcmH/NrfF
MPSKFSLLILVVTALSFGQMLSVDESNIRRVGIRIACQCGCKDTVAGCKMSLCGSAEPARAKIARLLGAGMSSDDIVESFVQEWGEQARRAPPALLSWIIPYLALAFGLAFLCWLLRKGTV